MKEKGKRLLILGGIFIVGFTLWTLLIQAVDVSPTGVNGTDIGFSTINNWFHKLTGVHMSLYVITDWLGLVPIFVCMVFGFIGLIQLIKRRSLFKVDYDIIFLGIYYVIVIFGYLIFEMVPINYRPVLINGILEASYPSSTTMLVMCVMPTAIMHFNCRIKNCLLNRCVIFAIVAFIAFMVIGRLVSGVHWITDIIGGALFSTAIVLMYYAICNIVTKNR